MSLSKTLSTGSTEEGRKSSKYDKFFFEWDVKHQCNQIMAKIRVKPGYLHHKLCKDLTLKLFQMTHEL